MNFGIIFVYAQNDGRYRPVGSFVTTKRPVVINDGRFKIKIQNFIKEIGTSLHFPDIIQVMMVNIVQQMMVNTVQGTMVNIFTLEIKIEDNIQEAEENILVVVGNIRGLVATVVSIPEMEEIIMEDLEKIMVET